MRHEKYAGWTAYWIGEPPSGIGTTAELLALTTRTGEVIKDDHRSMVKRLIVDGHGIAAKQPRDKNRRKWIRLLSLVRNSEVRHTLTTLSTLQREAVETVRPIAALEKRVWGMVVDSWLFYFYRTGKPCSREQLQLIIDVLQALHRAGFRHEDPHIENFLYDGEKVFVIDCKGKPRLGKFSDYNDFLLMEQKTNGGLDIIRRLNIDTSTPAYRLMRAYRRYRSIRYRLKTMVRDWSRAGKKTGAVSGPVKNKSRPR